MEEFLANVEERQKATLRLRTRVLHLNILTAQVAKKAAVDRSVILLGSRVQSVVSARRTLCYLALKEHGYTGAEVARFLGTTTSSVNRLAKEGETAGPKRIK